MLIGTNKVESGGWGQNVPGRGIREQVPRKKCLRKRGKFNTSGRMELRLQSGRRQSWRAWRGK